MARWAPGCTLVPVRVRATLCRSCLPRRCCAPVRPLGRRCTTCGLQAPAAAPASAVHMQPAAPCPRRQRRWATRSGSTTRRPPRRASSTSQVAGLSLDWLQAAQPPAWWQRGASRSYRPQPGAGAAGTSQRVAQRPMLFPTNCDQPADGLLLREALVDPALRRYKVRNHSRLRWLGSQPVGLPGCDAPAACACRFRSLPPQQAL